MEETFLRIENINLWARVGVLEEETKLGQLFSLDINLWGDFSRCSKNDNIIDTIDYSILIELIQSHSKEFKCYTIEKFSQEILEIIKQNFDLNKIKIKLTKCNAPINGFSGNVSIVKIFKKKQIGK